MNHAAFAPSAPTVCSSGQPHSLTICLSRSAFVMCNCLHAWNIAAPKLAGINQFLTNSQVFDAHCNQFFSKGIIQQGSDRIYAPWGEDPFVALQYAIDYIGQLLDAAVDRQQLQDRKKRSCGDNNGWIWRYPRLSTGKRLDSL
jgi:hypothetical protein